MDSQIIQHKNELLNAAIYIDYENIYELLKRYGADPLEINFFPVILTRFRNEWDLNINECIAYGNFEKKTFQGKHLSALHYLGVDPRHAASQGKNCGDMMLTVDALSTLYKNPGISVFIIVSSDRDMIPLLKAIKRENKFTFMLSTKFGFNPVVSHYTDLHEYIEDLFCLTPEMLIKNEEESSAVRIKINNPNTTDVENAKEVAKLLYSSNVWKVSEKDGQPVTLKGYLKIISSKLSGDSRQIIGYFEIAHHQKYITLYNDQNKGLCIKRGDNYMEIERVTMCKE